MKRYLFDPEVVDQCALAGIGHPKPQMFDLIARAIEARYPGTIYHDQPWIYSIAGGAMIQMKLYFASLNEYIMIWGTPIGSEGHSGRHRVAFWDTVLDGETWYYAEGQFEKRVYKPGDRIFVGVGQACGMNFTDGVWALEYARGKIPRSMPFGLADEILSCRDFMAAKQTVWVYATLIGRHWSAPYSRGFLRKLAGRLMNRVGQRAMRRLAPPPPKEITRAPRLMIRGGASSGSGRRPAAARTGEGARSTAGARSAAGSGTAARRAGPRR
jgi:hypothetical protein